MIYHLLPEWEAFSTYSGGAVSRDIANIVLLDPLQMIVSKDADDSWGISRRKIMIMPGLRPYSKVVGRGSFPPFVTNQYLRRSFGPLLSKLKRGDVVWCHSQPFFCTALQHSIKRLGVKLVYHVHSSLVFKGARTLLSSFSADAYVFVSNATRDEALAAYPWLTNTHVIHNGADSSLFYPRGVRGTAGPGAATILFVGRLHPQKGVHVLIEAMRILQKRGIAARCKVVGSAYAGGSKATRYVKELQRASPSNVDFINYIPARSIADQFRHADIACCPSVCQEAFGNVVIEAMACAVPVVASKVGGIPEIAAEGGVKLVQPGCPEELADALQELLSDPKRRITMGDEGARSFRKRFTWQTAVKQYSDVIAKLCRS
jgi:spore coat protein SA